MAACYQTGRRSASVELDPRYADVIIPSGGHNVVAIDMLLTLIRSLAK
jgi:uridine kinase